jgi:hypothetical protein
VGPHPQTAIEHLLSDSALGTIEMREDIVHEQIGPRAIVERGVGRMFTEEVRDVLEIRCLRSRQAPPVAQPGNQLPPCVPRRPHGKRDECRD